jgi:hypothetical protein
MPKTAVNALEIVTQDAAEIVTREVMRELDMATRHLINLKDARHYTPRENQKATVGFLAQLINHQTFRERYVLYALNNPGKAMEHAIATLPKEIMVENHTYLEKVEIIQPATLEQWQAMIQEKPKETIAMDAAVIEHE